MLVDSEVKGGGRDPGGSLQRRCQCPWSLVGFLLSALGM